MTHRRLEVLAGALLGLAGAALAQNRAPQVNRNAEVHVWPAQGNIYMVVGPGGNTTVQVSPGTIVPSASTAGTQ